ncbi:DNA methyltransferase [Xanthomonas translucens]|uniref:DNA methyltransferase n=1 Tax=Xanthomonas campestris pv. translucens TaxID=343 RepID=UPI0009BC50F7|nr:DNA methyltransferase [Xanthomonas translucens]MCT8271655.1 DNA methyltransferase [Xanthomonas translucens pv. undulosa]WNJ32443.1 DNA methyltransferase [Xanthomonas translucens pv. undulosa]
MSAFTDKIGLIPKAATTALECDFPLVEISQVAEQESWRKEINRPIYHIHKWWATRLGSVFRGITLGALSSPGTDIWAQFYKTHNLADKVVLDPFMGSGTTLGEAVKLGAKAIGCDINPVSTFLVRQAFTPMTDAQLRAAFEQLERDVAPEIRRYYQTRDPQTNELIPVLYYFWVKTVATPDGEIVPLLSRYVFSQDAYPKKKPRAQIVCPACWGLLEGRYDAVDLECQHCCHRFNPQEGPVAGQYVTTKRGGRYKVKELLPHDGSPLAHRMYAMMALRADGTKVYLPARDEDLALYEEAKARLSIEALPLPEIAVRPGHNTDQARGYNYTQWRDFFNARQLLCLGLLLREILSIDDQEIQEQMLCLFSSTLEFNNLFCSFKGEGTGAVRHMFSNHILKPERTPLENSVWGTAKSSGTFSTLFESRLLRAKRYLDDPFEIILESDSSGNRVGSRKILASNPIRARRVETWTELEAADHGLLILNGDSSSLPIPAGTVDAVVTDPPYFDFVHYSELSDFFFAWLSPVLRERYPWMAREDSSDQGEVQHKDPRVFARQLAAVFTEASRVLKDDGVLAFSFHHSRPEGWAAIYEAINKSGLAVVSVHPVHAELRAASPKSAAKDPISLDAILVCRKKGSYIGQASIRDVRKEVDAISAGLRAAGLHISIGDQFVIGAALTLIERAAEDLTFDEIKVHLDAIRVPGMIRTMAHI